MLYARHAGFLVISKIEIAAAVDIPVYLSSVVQVPWIKTGLKPSHKIGMLTADAHGITPNLFRSCGIDDPSIVVVRDLGRLPEFSAIIESKRIF